MAGAWRMTEMGSRTEDASPKPIPMGCCYLQSCLTCSRGKENYPSDWNDKRTHCPQQGYLRTTDVAATEKQVLLCLLCSSLALWQPVLTPMFLAGLLAGINSI